MPAQPFVRSVELQNFRGFKALKIEPLRRITLFGGLNGTGKTTVLDAVFQLLDSANPMVLMRSAQFRQTPTSLSAIHKINEGRAPSAPSIHRFKTRDGAYELVWTWGSQDMGQSPPQMIQNNAKVNTQTTSHQVGYHCLLKKDGKIASSRRYAGDVNDSFLFKPEINESFSFPTSSYMTRTTILSPGDLAARYSSVVQSGLKADFISVLNSLSRRFDNVEILHIANLPVIHLTLDDIIIPLSFAGDGVSTVAAIALAIMNAKGGVVLIDEFDASVHYSRLKQIWRVFYDLSVKYDCQLIVATHSRESAIALFEAIDKHNHNDVVYWRLDNVDGRNIGTSYSYEEMNQASSEGWEFR